MKILFISQTLPYPEAPAAGSIDLFHLIKSLSTRHDVTLTAFCHASQLSRVTEMEQYCTVVPVPTSDVFSIRVRSVLRTLLYRPWRIGRRAHYDMKETIQRITSQQRFDVVQFVFLSTGQYRPDLRQETPTMLDEVGVMYLPLERAYHEATLWLQRWLFGRSYHRAKAAELALCRQMDKIITRSERDRLILLKEDPTLDVEVRKTWMGVDEYADIPLERYQPGVILFQGAMNRDLNVEAVHFFHDKVWPTVRQAVPEAEFLIVGNAPAPSVARLSEAPGVTVTGGVPSMKPYYARCAISIAPIFVGWGIITKVVMSMAAGRPVVTTRVSNDGIQATSGRDLLIADTPEEFAEATICLLVDPDVRLTMARNGRRFALNHFGWQQAVAEYEAICERLVAR